jgi:hypothetical protein
MSKREELYNTMKIISHRGNITGPNKGAENKPEYILEAITQGFDVEIDVWYIDKRVLLGHDFGQYQINPSFLKNKHLWCHAKNLEALEFMLENDIHCFWHQGDNRTLTSKGFIWTYEGHSLGRKSIACWMNADGDFPSPGVFGICTDYPYKVKDILEQN